MRIPTARDTLVSFRPLAWLLPAMVLAFAGCQDEVLVTEPEAEPQLSAMVQPGVVGQDDWIVVFKGEVPDAPGLAQRLVAENGGFIAHTYAHALKGFAGTLPPQAIEAIQRNPQVAFVERDGIMTASAVGSWGLDRIDERALTLDGVYAPPLIANHGAGVTVYVIDSGIDFVTYSGSYEFGDRLSSGYDFVNEDSDAQDCHGHGTHVAGTVGSQTYGVAKGADIVGVRVLGCTGSGSYSDVIAGINWVAANRIDPAVANMSLGGGYSSSVNLAVSNAVGLGVTFAVSAGNENTDACTKSPASTPEAITVGSTTSSDARSSFSNYGSCVDLFAPGSAITSTIMDGGSASWSGTSMASPHVAGVAALLLAVNSGFGPAEVWAAMEDRTTRDVVSNPGPLSPNLLLYSGTDSGDPCATGGCPEVEVQWVSEAVVSASKNRAKGSVTVQVVEVGGDPLAGVTVNGSWTVNGSEGFTTSSGVTGTDGMVELSTGMILRASSFVFCVTSLTGMVMDPTDYGADPRCSPFGTPAGGTDPPIDPPTSPAPGNLDAAKVLKGKTWRVQLTWDSGGPSVDILRDGAAIAPGIENTGTYADNLGKTPEGSFTYQVCNAGSTAEEDCSEIRTVDFP